MRKAARRRGTVCRPRLCRPFALHCRAGVHARRGALRRPGRILAGQGAAPLSRLTPPAPLTGEPSGWQALYKASPARGGVTEGDGGVHCRFAPQVSCKARQCPALCFVGDDACIVPETLQRRKPHAAGEIARRGALRRSGRILARQGAAPLSRLTPPAPLTGEPSGWQALYKASPARGGVTEGDGGVHCRFALEISCKARQSLALHP